MPNRDHAYYQIGQHQLAIDDYLRAIELDPNYASPYFNRGNVYGRFGHRIFACTDMRKACELWTEQGDERVIR